MKILSTQQTREADAYTIEQEPILSIDLMERASRRFVTWFVKEFPKDKYLAISVICGKGNNGGDGLAIARLLQQLEYDVAVFIVDLSDQTTQDFESNLERVEQLEKLQKLEVRTVNSLEDMPIFGAEEILIDAILGSGLSRAVEGELAEIVQFINECENTIVAVDVPTGVFTESPTTGAAIEADYTFTFEAPKLAFLFPENFHYVGDFVYKSIGLHPSYLATVETPFHYITSSMVGRLYKKRDKFAHKGVFGHALLITGSYGKMGAAILATKACLRAGVGLVTVHVPICGYEIIQTSVPEAMVSLDEDRFIFTKVYDLPKYSTIGIGCGLSTKNRTRNALCYMLKHVNKPTVLDADALNILGQSPDWFEYVPAKSILTPHPKEFERMFGRAYDNFERNELQRQKAQEYDVYIILKGANTCIATPEGLCYFNSTGNPGMGTAGSGDVLTGILTGLLAQEYNPLEACVLGVYLHGLAGDIGAAERSEESLTAGDLVDYLGKAFLQLKSY
jgi:NAD(P)H-hydrate epimerase